MPARDECQWRTVDASGLADLRKTFLALNSDQVNRLEVCCGRCYMGRLQNLLQLFRLHLLVVIAAYRLTLFCNIDKFHNN